MARWKRAPRSFETEPSTTAPVYVFYFAATVRRDGVFRDIVLRRDFFSSASCSTRRFRFRSTVEDPENAAAERVLPEPSFGALFFPSGVLQNQEQKGQHR